MKCGLRVFRPTIEMGGKILIINCFNILGINNGNYQLLRNTVSQERRKRADRYHLIVDSYRCICAELLLQYSLYQVVGQYVEINLAYNKFGKPYMKNMSDFLYNLSHSGDWVVIAYGNTNIGVDIEKIQIGNERIADKVFTKEEKSFINSVTGIEKSKRFTQIWTLKESYIKYLGTGLSTRMDSFSINVIDSVINNHNGKIQDDLIIKSDLYDTDYYLSVCGEEKKVTVNEIMLEDLIQFIDRKQLIQGV